MNIVRKSKKIDKYLIEIRQNKENESFYVGAYYESSCNSDYYSSICGDVYSDSKKANARFNYLVRKATKGEL